MTIAAISALPLLTVGLSTGHVLCQHARHSRHALCRASLCARKRPKLVPHRRCGCKRQKLQTCAQASGASTKTLKETAALDQLIDLLLGAKSQQQVSIVLCQQNVTHKIHLLTQTLCSNVSVVSVQLAKLVADNILSLDQKFWLRLATRSDTATTKEDKQK